MVTKKDLKDERTMTMQKSKKKKGETFGVMREACVDGLK